MDLEKAMAFVLEQEARLNVLMQELARKMDGLTDRMLEMEERHDREMPDIRTASGDLRSDLRRAIRLSVEEQRREWVRRQETGSENHAVSRSPGGY